MNLYLYVEGNPVNFGDPWGFYSLADASKSLRNKGINGRLSQTKIFNEWLLLELNNTDWLEELPTCPQIISPEKNPDPSIWFNPTEANPEHQGAVYEMRSRPTNGGHASQCSYDCEGNLMTSIPAGGTADRGAWAKGTRMRHFTDDWETWKMAQKLHRETDYYLVRPPM